MINLNEDSIVLVKWIQLNNIAGLSLETLEFLEGLHDVTNFITTWEIRGDLGCENRIYRNDLADYLDYADHPEGKLKKQLKALVKLLEKNGIDYLLTE